LESGARFLLFKLDKFSLALELPVLRKIYDAAGFPFRTAGSRMIDLHRLTGAESKAAINYWIEMDLGAGRYLLPVEDVEGIRELSLAVPLPYPPVLRRPETRYIQTLLFDGLRMIVLLDAGGLVEVSEEKDKLKFRVKSKSSMRDAAAPAPVPAVPDQPESAAAGKVVVFAAGGELWKVALDQVIQILNAEELYPLPSTGPGIAGAIYYAESAVPVIAPFRLSESARDRKPDPETAISTVILLETPPGPLGIGCERIVKVVGREAGPGKGEETAGTAGDLLSAAREVRSDLLLKRLVG
jgi:chemotaxis signal transduction protein